MIFPDFLIASRRGYMRSGFAQAACLARKEGDLQFGKPQRTRLLSADAPLVTAVRWNSFDTEKVATGSPSIPAKWVD